MAHFDNDDLYSAITINTWYSAQELFIAEEGRTPTEDEKRKLLIKVSGLPTRLLKGLEMVKANDQTPSISAYFHQIVIGDDLDNFGSDDQS